ncbi:hypothetical protein Nepgr_012793 [Nepenthes gracilis]|uniref:Uncharacterized protein n=1 Tax=Nepenthes gracilis TaxID=150966 RepID=A0AAD3SHX0_NEPGR|nr:hypothetical protein Nepgr_012793 [Nepenthes gracilis]
MKKQDHTGGKAISNHLAAAGARAGDGEQADQHQNRQRVAHSLPPLTETVSHLIIDVVQSEVYKDGDEVEVPGPKDACKLSGQ